MKKRIKRKSDSGIHIHLTNRWLYTFIAIGILIAVGIGVYAYGTDNPSVFGHSIGELAPPSFCSANTYLKFDGTNWVCANVTSVNWASITGIPAGFADGIDNTGSKLNGIWQCPSGGSCTCGPSPRCTGQIIYSATQPTCGCGVLLQGFCQYQSTSNCNLLGYLIQ